MIGALLSSATPDWLEEVLRRGHRKGLPLRQILHQSLFYPACGLNGTPVKYMSGNIHSFIYADYGVSRIALLKNLHGVKSECGFRGYKLASQMDICRDQLVPVDWRPRLTPEPSGETLELNIKEASTEPFCHWSVWRRMTGFGPNHGPEAFSFLFIGGEMSAVYQGLYCYNRIKPKVLALIQPGCMGGEWENPCSDLSFFKEVIRSNPAGMPDYLLYGGFGGRSYFENPCWSEYLGKKLTQLPERYAGLWGLSSHSGFLSERSAFALDGEHKPTAYPEKRCRLEPLTGPGFFLTLGQGSSDLGTRC